MHEISGKFLADNNIKIPVTDETLKRAFRDCIVSAIPDFEGECQEYHRSYKDIVKRIIEMRLNY